MILFGFENVSIGYDLLCNYCFIALWLDLGFLTTDQSIKIAKAIIALAPSQVNPLLSLSLSLSHTHTHTHTHTFLSLELFSMCVAD
jgi:hypothetical protein